MKQIKTTGKFEANYKKRIAKNSKLMNAFIEAVDSLLTDPTSVNDHGLKGRLNRFRAFSVTEDYRIVYTDNQDFFLFYDIGTHNQVYR